MITQSNYFEIPNKKTLLESTDGGSLTKEQLLTEQFYAFYECANTFTEKLSDLENIDLTLADYLIEEKYLEVYDFAKEISERHLPRFKNFLNTLKRNMPDMATEKQEMLEEIKENMTDAPRRSRSVYSLLKNTKNTTKKTHKVLNEYSWPKPNGPRLPKH